MANLERRIEQLEMKGSGNWRAWAGVPADQWPDEALIAYLKETTGLDVGPSLADLNEDVVRSIAEGARHGA